MSTGFIQQVEIVPAINGEDVAIFFAIAAETVNPFGGSAINTHRASLNADEVTEEVREAAKVIYDACVAATADKLPMAKGVRATLQMKGFEETVTELKAKRAEK